MTSGGSFTVYFDYEAIKDNLACKIDLNAYFIEKVIGNTAVDTLDIGTVHFPTGKIFACDLLLFASGWGDGVRSISAMTLRVRSAGCISTSLILQRVMMHDWRV